MKYVFLHTRPARLAPDRCSILSCSIFHSHCVPGHFGRAQELCITFAKRYTVQMDNYKQFAMYCTTPGANLSGRSKGGGCQEHTPPSCSNSFISMQFFSKSLQNNMLAQPRRNFVPFPREKSWNRHYTLMGKPFGPTHKCALEYGAYKNATPVPDRPRNWWSSLSRLVLIFYLGALCVLCGAIQFSLLYSRMMGFSNNSFSSQFFFTHQKKASLSFTWHFFFKKFFFMRPLGFLKHTAWGLPLPSLMQWMQSDVTNQEILYPFRFVL